nr:hypothetical protein CFP56_11620 [Quercus suber]
MEQMQPPPELLLSGGSLRRLLVGLMASAYLGLHGLAISDAWRTDGTASRLATFSMCPCPRPPCLFLTE